MIKRLLARWFGPSDKAAKAKAEAEARHAYWQDEYARMNYYNDYDFARYTAAGSPPVVGTDRQAEFVTPPMPREQWDKLTPEQKADTAHPVFP